MKPLLIFDLDGTLADTSLDLIAALNKVLADYQEAQVAVDDVRHLISQGAVGLLSAGFGHAYASMSDEKKQMLFDSFVAYYEQIMLDNIALYPGVEAVLNTLSTQGFKMAICSNKNTNLAECILEHLSIKQYFTAVCGGDFFSGFKKPDRRHVEGVMVLAGFERFKGYAIFIGDAMSDMKAAKNTGIPSVFVAYGFADMAPNESGANAIVHQADELPQAISSLANCLMSGRAFA